MYLTFLGLDPRGGAGRPSGPRDGGEVKIEPYDEKKHGKRCTLMKWNAVAYWTFLSHDGDNICSICTVALEERCLCQCQANPQFTEECTVVYGQCNHSYHNHCIMQWLKKSQKCPKCPDEEWVVNQ